MRSGTPANRKKLPSNVRFAVWQCHGAICWMCKEPLRFLATVIDHVIPESLSRRPAELERIIHNLGLPTDFDIDGFENLLPSCAPCNLAKGKRVFEPNPMHKHELDKLASKASWVGTVAERVKKNVATDRIIKSILVALEKQTMSMAELEGFLIDIVRVPDQIGVPDDVIILGDGFWYRKANIVAEGPCRCERDFCVGTDRKVYCYYHSELSPWVIATGLYFLCYDEVVACPRCGQVHKRGHIGRADVCGRPFVNQAMQID
jgi:5-methylcytosine-specific restriction endonuclease McrA